MIGELITGGLSLIGSLFGKKKQTTTSTVDYGRMVKDATAAGFNPLTAIRNGGSAGFTQTTTPTTSMLPEAFANLGGILGPAAAKALDPLEAKKRVLDTALVDYQLRQLKQGPTSAPILRPGGTFTGTKVTRQSVPAVGPSAAKPAPFRRNSLTYGPFQPEGAGKDGEILPAMVSWRRSDGTLMQTYHPDFPDGDAVIAAGVADAGNRATDEVNKKIYSGRPSPRRAPLGVNNGTGSYYQPSLFYRPKAKKGGGGGW